MYNILPEEVKKSLKKEYVMRVVSLALLMITSCMALGSVSLIPSYVMALQKKAEIQNELDTVDTRANSSDTKSYTEIANLLAKKTKAIALIDTERQPHESIDGVLHQKGPGVTIDQFIYQRVGTTSTLMIRGVAATRESFLSFDDGIKKSKLFKDADFPIELLARQRNINFTMKLQ